MFIHRLYRVAGMLLHLTSHRYPSYYPPDAYVLWTFQLASYAQDIVYHISFRHFYISDGDFLKIGSGWDPGDSLSAIVVYQHYYGYPSDNVIQTDRIFIEFDADYRYEWTGFNLSVNVQNTSGNVVFHITGICGALSRYPYKVGDPKSPESKKNTWKAELGHTAF